MLSKHGTNSIGCSDKPKKVRKIITLGTKLAVLAIAVEGEEAEDNDIATQLRFFRNTFHDFKMVSNE